MKKFTTLATLTTLAICGSAIALTITFKGRVTYGGVPVSAPNFNTTTYDYEGLGVHPLVELYGPEGLLAQTTVGAGQFIQPVSGYFQKSVSVVLHLGDDFYVIAYAGQNNSGPSAISGLLTIAPIAGLDETYDFGTINIIPEPTILLSGLALFLIRRKK